ncbi:LysR family transcriptional regulator [Streptomyces triculaminicus]|uniref:LysR family transcriptional regulator n=2 Tax=Streptomyces TaxID=1883 RepID=A0A939FL16_9ACTN|nr:MULTISPECIES: LysR family transcriptional regulator [Streptomyces]MBO0652488.1 LysR family transcriptional regulator [Streptomyces triculaminicus]QSY51910.1 LysR family transcriptional regulator [Streptomyces griseocarneus]
MRRVIWRAEPYRFMKLSQCAAFAAIIDTGSFTAAARALDISQSAVSHAISSLEKELGVGLMKRDRTGIELTETGRRVLAHTRAVLMHSEQMRHAANSAPEDLRGRIRIGTSQSFACRLLPALMTALRTRHPQLEIELRDGPDMQIADWLRGYAIDVGIVTLPKKDLSTIPLLQDRMYAVLPAAHRLAQNAGAGLRVQQLSTEPLLLPVGGMEAMVRAMFRTVGLEPHIAYRVQDVNALLAMVAGGHGITVLPSLAMPVMPAGLRVVPLTPAVSRKLAIAMSPRAKNSRAVAAFISVAQTLANREDWTQPPSRTGRPANPLAVRS